MHSSTLLDHQAMFPQDRSFSHSLCEDVIGFGSCVVKEGWQSFHSYTTFMKKICRAPNHYKKKSQISLKDLITIKNYYTELV